MSDIHDGKGGDNPKDKAARAGAARSDVTATIPPHGASQIHGYDTTPRAPRVRKSHRIRRALASLIDGEVMRTDMDRIIGTTNAPEYVSRLRVDGWSIATDRVPIINRDGGVSRIGRYRLAAHHRAVALDMLDGAQ